MYFLFPAGTLQLKKLSEVELLGNTLSVKTAQIQTLKHVVYLPTCQTGNTGLHHVTDSTSSRHVCCVQSSLTIMAKATKTISISQTQKLRKHRNDEHCLFTLRSHVTPLRRRRRRSKRPLTAAAALAALSQ